MTSPFSKITVYVVLVHRAVRTIILTICANGTNIKDGFLYRDRSPGDLMFLNLLCNQKPYTHIYFIDEIQELILIHYKEFHAKGILPGIM